ncbi:hypothetical protein [Kibdelosporangium phytohabitans]|uniref:Uncharacterized protein n=1 Tax=Kibdelosporangium phytohabitans TaxID=860235 RepID=A0A0N9HTX5_9PSEU|nr:hypothetical protein [Kibdelosporangium phytohabitans]ALG06365.1 hypothetical protein AOZ06_05000 [Kibdelosporangium phytohabitans]MBE1467508.1 hypothetical protein [Kibdelosporangium phytohabitans]
MDETGKYTPDVTPIDGVSADLVDLGLRYWALTGFDDHDTPLWAEAVKKIDTHGRGPANIVAAASARAVLPNVLCPDCGEPLRLASRTSLETVIANGATRCADCDPQLRKRVAAVLSPENEAARQERLAQKRRRDAAQQERAALQQATAHWRTSQQQALSAAFPDQLTAEPDLPQATVDVELAVLTLLRFADGTTPLPPLHDWQHPLPFHAGDEPVPEWLNKARGVGLLMPDASSDPLAFDWDPSDFGAVWQAAHGDPANLPTPTLADRYFPLAVRWRIPSQHPQPAAVEHLDAYLAERLRPVSLTAPRQEHLLLVAFDVLALEAIRFFNRELARHHLPEVMDNHAPRLRDAVDRLVAEFSLGSAYYLAWRATQRAASAAQATPHAPLRNMTTYAVNSFERDVHRALADPSVISKPFDENPHHPLAATTRTLFYEVLGLDPMHTSLSQARQAMPTPAAGHTDNEGRGHQDETGTLVEFTGRKQSEVVLLAGLYLSHLEEEHGLHFAVRSTHWDTREVTAHGRYMFSLVLDGVSVDQLPNEGAAGRPRAMNPRAVETAVEAGAGLDRSS